jgi:uncharacterized protein (DUF983 family)
VTIPSDPNQPESTSGLPNYPSAPAANEYGQTQQPAYAPPREIMISFWCYVGAAAIVLIGGLFAITLKQSVLDTLRNNNTTGLTASQLETAANAAVVVAVVISVIIAGLYLLFAFKLRAGRNWARIVLTVIAAIDLLSLISITRQGGSPISYIGALAAIAGCVLSYLPNASAYFTAVKASRQLR